jgi:hypothetical protein
MRHASCVNTLIANGARGKSEDQAPLLALSF